jgi:hypothetical protein
MGAVKKTREKAASAQEDLRPRLSAHPRAQRQIRDAKAWSGLVGFVLVGLLSMQAGAPLFDAGLRALACGVVCYVIGWAMAVAVWRHVARAEVRVLQDRLAAEPADG